MSEIDVKNITPAEGEQSPSRKIMTYEDWVKSINESNMVKLELSPNGAPKGIWVMMNWPMGYSQSAMPGQPSVEGELLIRFVYVRYPYFSDHIQYSEDSTPLDLAPYAIKLVTDLRNFQGASVPIGTWQMVKDELHHGDARSLGEALFLLLSGGELFREKSWQTNQHKI